MRAPRSIQTEAMPHAWIFRARTRILWGSARLLDRFNRFLARWPRGSFEENAALQHFMASTLVPGDLSLFGELEQAEALGAPQDDDRRLIRIQGWLHHWESPIVKLSVQSEDLFPVAMRLQETRKQWLGKGEVRPGLDRSGFSGLIHLRPQQGDAVVRFELKLGDGRTIQRSFPRKRVQGLEWRLDSEARMEATERGHFQVFGTSRARLPSLGRYRKGPIALPRTSHPQVSIVIGPGGDDEECFKSAISCLGNSEVEFEVLASKLEGFEGWIDTFQAPSPVSAARAPYLLFLSPGTELLPGALSAAMDVFATCPSTGVVGARVLDGSGEVIQAGGLLDAGNRHPSWRRASVSRPFELLFRTCVDFTGGPFVLTRTPLFRESAKAQECLDGNLNGAIEFCLRVRSLGFSIRVDPRVTVLCSDPPPELERATFRPGSLLLPPRTRNYRMLLVTGVAWSDPQFPHEELEASIRRTLDAGAEELCLFLPGYPSALWESPGTSAFGAIPVVGHWEFSGLSEFIECQVRPFDEVVFLEGDLRFSLSIHLQSLFGPRWGTKFSCRAPKKVRPRAASPGVPG